MTTPKLTPQQALDALRRAALDCIRAGISVKVGQMYDNNRMPQVGLIIDDVKLVDGQLVIVAEEAAS